MAAGRAEGGRIAVLKELIDVVSTACDGNIFQSEIVLGKKLYLNASVRVAICRNFMLCEALVLVSDF